MEKPQSATAKLNKTMIEVSVLAQLTPPVRLPDPLGSGKSMGIDFTVWLSHGNAIVIIDIEGIDYDIELEDIVSAVMKNHIKVKK